jgi:hypothetical protein
MATLSTFYRGDEIKFAIGLDCIGFDIDRDLFDIEVITPNSSVKASKGRPAPDGSLVIFKETDGDSSSSSSSSSEDEGTWYAIVDTQFLKIGDMRVVATAHVPDPNANDGIRKQVDVKPLGTLRNP